MVAVVVERIIVVVKLVEMVDLAVEEEVDRINREVVVNLDREDKMVVMLDLIIVVAAVVVLVKQAKPVQVVVLLLLELEDMGVEEHQYPQPSRPLLLI